MTAHLLVLLQALRKERLPESEQSTGQTYRRRAIQKLSFFTESIFHILQIFEIDLLRLIQRNPALSTSLHIFMTLCLFATGNVHHVFDEMTTVGVITRVTKVITRKSTDFIKFTSCMVSIRAINF